MVKAVLVSGSSRYADRWHDYPATSAALTELFTNALSEFSLDLVVPDGVDEALAGLDESTGLLIVNAGECSDRALGDPSLAAGEGLRRYLATNRPVLALHAAASAFTDEPSWEAAIGARWIPGTTWHPKRGPGMIKICAGLHPVVKRLSDFEIVDELYTDLRVAPWVNALAFHELDGATYPLVWAAERAGRRVVYDALGHDELSLASADHRRILKQALTWLVAEEAPAAG